jgi:hypothetical protein
LAIQQQISPRSSLVARHLLSAALQHYAHLSTKVANGDDPDLQSTNIILGHLPPAEMLLNNHCSSFPMATLPTIKQLNNAPQPMNSATTLAVSFVICQDVPSTSNLEQINTANTLSSNSTSLQFLQTPTTTQLILYPIMSTNSTVLPRLLMLLTPMCTSSDPRTTKCSNIPCYTLTESILHHWISN